MSSCEAHGSETRGKLCNKYNSSVGVALLEQVFFLRGELGLPWRSRGVGGQLLAPLGSSAAVMCSDMQRSAAGLPHVKVLRSAARHLVAALRLPASGFSFVHNILLPGFAFGC